jgi:NADH:ubiquinone oxidoreductase subunit 2 (subunit N)
MIENIFASQSGLLTLFAVFLMSAVSAYYYMRFIETLFFEPIPKNNFAGSTNDFLLAPECIALYVLTFLNLYFFMSRASS